MIDSHAHLDASQYDQDRSRVLERAFGGGIKYIVNTGSDLATSQASVALASQHEKIYATVGIHPMAEILNQAQDDNQGMPGIYRQLYNLVMSPKVMAIGECGLEINQISKVKNQKLDEVLKRQKEIFLAQVKLAQELNLPLVIHCRNAHQEMIEILSDVKNLKAVIHCYSGSWLQAERYLKLGCHLSFTGVVTYARDYDKVIKNMPLERMLLETDCPYLSPIPYRGQRNEPLYVKYVYATMAQVRGKPLEKIIKQVDQNVVDFFELCPKSF